MTQGAHSMRFPAVGERCACLPSYDPNTGEREQKSAISPTESSSSMRLDKSPVRCRWDANANHHTCQRVDSWRMTRSMQNALSDAPTQHLLTVGDNCGCERGATCVAVRERHALYFALHACACACGAVAQGFCVEDVCSDDTSKDSEQASLQCSYGAPPYISTYIEADEVQKMLGRTIELEARGPSTVRTAVRSVCYASNNRVTAVEAWIPKFNGKEKRCDKNPRIDHIAAAIRALGVDPDETRQYMSDQAGHIIARAFGGEYKAENLVPMSQGLNAHWESPWKVRSPALL